MLKKYFLTGLITLLPLAITLWALHFIIDFLTKPFLGLIYLFTDQLTPREWMRILSQILILIGLFLLTVFLGFTARRFFFKQMIRWGDHMMIKIPLVRTVYKTSKEIVSSFFNNQQASFKQVVLLPFPYPGCYCIGLIARDAPLTCTSSEHDHLISVFIPTAPNPTTGFLVMSLKSELIYLEMKSEEAIKYIVSCAVIQPKRAS